MIKIYINYKFTDEPWGGANNFIKNLVSFFKEDSEIEIINNIEKKFDIIFLNQLSEGPLNGSKDSSLRKLKNQKKSGKKIILRAINLKLHSYNHNIYHAYLDFRLINFMNNYVDFVIFQSEYQRNFFLGAGFRNINNTVIHNGTNPNIFKFISRKQITGKVKLISSAASSRESKNLKLLADISKIKSIEIYHVGAWDKSLDSNNIILLGTKTHSEMNELFSKMDGFIHLAYRDPCPNSIFEAISAGLPVIYYPNQTSSSEIVGLNGIPLNLNNYEETFDTFKNNYKELCDNLIKTRSYYSINRAANDYKKVFELLR